MPYPIYMYVYYTSPFNQYSVCPIISHHRPITDRLSHHTGRDIRKKIMRPQFCCKSQPRVGRLHCYQTGPTWSMDWGSSGKIFSLQNVAPWGLGEWNILYIRDYPVRASTKEFPAWTCNVFELEPSNLHLRILSVENEGHWSSPSRLFGHFDSEFQEIWVVGMAWHGASSADDWLTL